MSTIPGVAQTEIIGAANFDAGLARSAAARGAQGDRLRRAAGDQRQLPSAPGRTENEFVSQSITLKLRSRPPKRSARCRSAGWRSCGGCATWPGSRSAPRDNDTIVTFNGQAGTFLGIFPTPRQPAHRRRRGGEGTALDQCLAAQEGRRSSWSTIPPDDQRLDPRSVQHHRRGR